MYEHELGVRLFVIVQCSPPKGMAMYTVVFCEVAEKKDVYVLKKKRLGEVAECKGGN